MRIAQRLEAQRDVGEPVTVGDLARHFLAAAPLADADKAAYYAEAAGREAAERLALDKAATWYQRALEVRATPADRAAAFTSPWRAPTRPSGATTRLATPVSVAP